MHDPGDLETGGGEGDGLLGHRQVLLEGGILRDFI
jgi:hypothetical protein